MSQEARYSVIEIRGKSMFIDSVTIPSGVEHSKTYEGDKNEMCTLLLENVEESIVNSIRRQITVNKTKFYGARSAVSVGKIGAKLIKSTLSAAKAFGQTMQHEMKDVYRDSYEDTRGMEEDSIEDDS